MTVKFTRPRIFVTALCFAVFVNALFFVALINHWFGYHVEEVTEFCEAARPGLIKEPANTFSNIGFIVAGLYMAWQMASGRFDAFKNSFTKQNFYAIFYSCVVIFLGPGSMAKHATKTGLGGFFDMLSMYLIASFIAAYAIQRFLKLSWWVFGILFTIFLCSCIKANFIHYTAILGFFGNAVFAFYLLLGIVFEFLNIYVRNLEHDYRWAYFSLASLIGAFFVWNLSRSDGGWCNPYSLFQGHAVWHLGDALGAYFLFRFYVSEKCSF